MTDLAAIRRRRPLEAAAIAHMPPDQRAQLRAALGAAGRRPATWCTVAIAAWRIVIIALLALNAALWLPSLWRTAVHAACSAWAGP